MVAASILPIAEHNSVLYFLFGLENKNENSAKGWSDFGGGIEGEEPIYDAAVREGVEEMTGFLGTTSELKSLIQKGNLKRLTHNNYHVHMFTIPYDKNLPIYYNNTHAFLWKNTCSDELSKPHYEKIKMRWFSQHELKTKRHLFRPFYREIVDEIVKMIPELKRKERKTRKKH
jgi:hypothetical protein